MEVKEYIVAEADKLFCQFGFKSVTMDDIAKHLGMSKKTIYHHFKDKNELVDILIKERLTNQDCANHQFVEQAEDAVHEIFFVLESMHDLLGNMNPKLFYDLQKYHAKTWLYFKNFKEQSMSKAILTNLERGITEGIYRDDIKTDILTQLRLDHVELIFNQHDHYTANKYSISQVMIEITEHFLYGICNEKGLSLIKKYKENPTITLTQNN